MVPEIKSQAFPVACFAPDLSDILLSDYRHLIYDQPEGPVKDALLKCYDCVATWWNVPVSQLEPTKLTVLHKKQRVNVNIVPFDDEIKEHLDSVTPWDYEIQGLKDILETITETQLRNAAFHLLWHVIEICNDREPLTQSSLNK